MDRSDFLLDTPLEAGPTFLPAEGLQAAVHSVLHHRDELLVAQHAVAVVVKNLKQKKSVFKRLNHRSYGHKQCMSVYVSICLYDHPVQLEDNKNVVKLQIKFGLKKEANKEQQRANINLKVFVRQIAFILSKNTEIKAKNVHLKSHITPALVFM